MTTAIVGTVSNLEPVCQTKLSLENNELNNNEPAQYLDGWLISNGKYCKQHEASVSDKAKSINNKYGKYVS